MSVVQRAIGYEVARLRDQRELLCRGIKDEIDGVTDSDLAAAMSSPCARTPPLAAMVTLTSSARAVGARRSLRQALHFGSRRVRFSCRTSASTGAASMVRVGHTDGRTPGERPLHVPSQRRQATGRVGGLPKAAAPLALSLVQLFLRANAWVVLSKRSHS
jgi:hypothetical protein